MEIECANYKMIIQPGHCDPCPVEIFFYFCVDISVQSSGFCSTEIFSIIVITDARFIRNMLKS